MDQDFPLGLSYDDVLLVPQYSNINSRSDVDISSQITPRVKLDFPVISSNMTDVTGVKMAIALGKLGGMGIIPRWEEPKAQADMVRQIKQAGVPVAASVGCKGDYLTRAKLLVEAGVDILQLDVAHGHMQQAVDATKKLKELFGDRVDILAGTVASAEGAKNLFTAGADCVKVGIGAGSICITRIQTGCGVPQLTAVLDCVKVAQKVGKTIMADGGIKASGDIVKALAAGASSVCCGNIFAGTDETPGELIEIGNIKYKIYRGSTSTQEKTMHAQKLLDINKTYLNHIEGVAGMVPYKGSVKDLVTIFSANIKSGFSYCGAHNLSELWQKAKFIRITPLGQRENGVHDLSTQEP